MSLCSFLLSLGTYIHLGFYCFLLWKSALEGIYCPWSDVLSLSLQVLGFKNPIYLLIYLYLFLMVL